MDEITFHSDGYERRHAAVNVKIYSSYPKTNKLRGYFERLGIDDEEFNKLAEHTEEGIKEFFWQEDLPMIAEEHGFGKVYSEGRSGGWAAPNPPIHEEDFENDPDLVRRFLAFQSELKAEVASVDDTIAFQLKDLWSEYEYEFLRGHSVTIRSILAWKKARAKLLLTGE